MSLLRKKIFNFANDIIGLDLGDLSVKLVKFEDEGDQEKVVSFGSIKIPTGCIYDGEIKNKEVVASTIKKLIESAGPKKIKSKKVICSLPETKAFLRVVSIPRMNDDEVAEAVKWEMEANIPLPLDQVYYDWQSLKKNIVSEKNKMNILVVAVAKPIVDQTIEILEMAGLEPVGLEIESVAQARSLLDQKKEDRTILIVDVGDRRTSFSVSKDNVPCFTSSIPICGQSLTEAISKGLNMSVSDAEEEKMKYGIGSDFKNDAIFKAVKPVLDNLASEIEKSIDFYVSGLGYSNAIDEIILCGGGSNTKGIVPYLAKNVGREIKIGNPWVNVLTGKDLPAIDKQEVIQYSTAIGLALKGLHYEDLS